MGTESVYGAPLGPTSVNPNQTGRPVAGPADPAVLRARLAEELRASRAAAPPAVIGAPAAPANPLDRLQLGGLLGQAMEHLRNRPKRIEEAVNGQR